MLGTPRSGLSGFAGSPSTTSSPAPYRCPSCWSEGVPVRGAFTASQWMPACQVLPQPGLTALPCVAHSTLLRFCAPSSAALWVGMGALVLGCAASGGLL